MLVQVFIFGVLGKPLLSGKRGVMVMDPVFNGWVVAVVDRVRVVYRVQVLPQP